MPKLCVFGCSYSDYLPNNRTVYGRELAQLLDREYLHHGACSGSNWRIWRELAQAVMSGQITDQDLVLVQYTGMERREFWSRFHSPTQPGESRPRDPGPEQGDLVRYKAMSWSWMDHRLEREFFKIYEENFVSLEYERSWFDIQHLQLQLLLLHYGIRTVFMDSRLVSVRPLPVIAPFDQWLWLEPQWLQLTDEYDNLPGDNSHFNDLGHRVVAGLLLDHIRALGW